MSGLAEALAKVQANLPHIQKTKTANTGTFSYKYADLGDIAPAVHPLLAEHGLAWVTRPTLTEDGRFVLSYALKHGESGEEEAGDYPLPDPTKTTPQQVGSAITYARRYAFCCVTGVVPDEDDDGRAANDVKASGRRKPAERKAERGPLPAEQDQWSTEGPKERKTDAAWVEGWRISVLSAETPEPLEALEAQLRRAWDEHRLTLGDKDDLKALLTEKRSDLAEIKAKWPPVAVPPAGDAA